MPARSIATLLLAVGVATCSDTPIAAVKTGTTPASRTGRGVVAFTPVFSKSAQFAAAHLSEIPGISFDSVRIVIRGNPDTTEIVKDTTVFFDPKTPEITLDLNVPVQNDGQRFNAAMDYKGPSGVVFHGAIIVQSHAPDQPAPPQQQLVVNYVGPGSRVKSITVSPKTINLSGTQSAPLTVTATDSSGASATVPPLLYATSNASVASVSATGLVQGQNRRGAATITVSTPTGISDNAGVNVVLPASAIVLVSGGGQSGKVGTTLGSPAVVQVTASDGVGVAGVNVVFSAPAGGSVSPTSTTTDAGGRATTTLKLGSTAGPQGFAATAGSFSVGIGATATAGDPAAIAIVSGNNQTDSVHATLKPLTVKVSDTFGNAVTGASVSWSKSGAGALGSATTATGADGLATNGYTLGGAVGSESATATIAGQSATFNFTVTGGGPATITAVSGNNQNGIVQQALPAPLVVKVLDVAGNPVQNASVSWSAQNATISSTTPSDASGVASASVTLGSIVGTATITAGIPNGKSVAFAATTQSGPPAHILFAQQPANGTAGQPLAAVKLELRDASNNVSTQPASATISLTTNSAGAHLAGTLTRPSVNGVVTFDDLVVDRAGSGYTLHASINGGPSATSTAFNVSAGAASGFTINAGNGQSATVNTPVATAPAVKIVDGSNNPIIGASVTFAPATGSGSVLPAGGAVTTNALGIATLDSWTLGTVAGSQSLVVSSPGLQPLTITATATPANAYKLKLSNKNALQTAATSGSALSPQPSIQLVDQFGNAVPAGQMQVTAALVANSTPTLGGSTSLTLGATTGAGTFTNLSLSGSGSTQIVFKENSGQIKPDTSAAITVSSASPTQILFVPATTSVTVTAGQSITLPQVKVADAQGNGVGGIVVHAVVDSGTAPNTAIIGADNYTTNSSGLVTTLGSLTPTAAGIYRLTITSTSVQNASTVLTATVNAGAAYKVAFANRASIQSTLVSGGTLSPQPIVQVSDQYGNPVSLSSVEVRVSTAPSSGFTVGGTTTLQLNASGRGTYSGLSITGSGALRLVVAPTSGTLLPDSSNTITASTGTPASLSIVSTPANQTVFSFQAGVTPTNPPVVKVADVNGNGVSSVPVRFVVTAVNSTTVLKDTTISTNGSGTISIAALPVTTVGAYTIVMTSTAVNNGNTNVTATVTILPGTPTALRFVAPAPNTTTGTTAGTTIPLGVELLDAFGNVAVNAPATSVTVALTSAGGATLHGTTTVQTSSGVAAFAATEALWIDKAAPGYTFTATSSGLTSATSGTLNVSAGAAKKLAFVAPPAATASGAVMSPVTVQITDSLGNVVSGATNTISLSLTPSETLGGTTSTAAVNSVATFNNLTISTARSYTMTASAGVNDGLAPVTSASFAISASTATRMTAYGSTSLSTTAGTALTSRPAVMVTDGSNNPVVGDSILFTIAANSGTVTGSKTVDTVITSNLGVALMSAWTLPTTAGAYTVAATPLRGSLTNAPMTFTATVSAAAVSQLVFVAGHGLPATIENDALFSNGPQLLASDAYGNPISGLTIDATVENQPSFNRIPNRPGPAANDFSMFALPSLSLVTSKNTNASGIADFSGAKLRGLVQSFGLRFTAHGTSVSTVAGSTLRHGGAHDASCTATSLPGRVGLSHSLSVLPKLKIVDVDGNIVDNTGVTLGATAGSLSQTTGFTTDANGEVTGSTWVARGSAGVDSVKANGVAGGCGINVAALHHIKLSVTSLGQRKNGDLLPSIDATVVDVDGNAIEDTTFTVAVVGHTHTDHVISMSDSKSSDSHGKSTFASLTVDAAEQTGATLDFVLNGQSAITGSVTLDVDVGDATDLDAGSTNTAHGVLGVPLVNAFSVAVKDHNKHNNVTSASSTVTWTLGSGCSAVSFALASQLTTATSQASSGSATSPTFYILSALSGSCTVTASAPGLTSTAFSIIP